MKTLTSSRPQRDRKERSETVRGTYTSSAGSSNVAAGVQACNERDKSAVRTLPKYTLSHSRSQQTTQPAGGVTSTKGDNPQTATSSAVVKSPWDPAGTDDSSSASAAGTNPPLGCEMYQTETPKVKQTGQAFGRHKASSLPLSTRSKHTPSKKWVEEKNNTRLPSTEKSRKGEYVVIGAKQRGQLDATSPWMYLAGNRDNEGYSTAPTSPPTSSDQKSPSVTPAKTAKGVQPAEYHENLKVEACRNSSRRGSETGGQFLRGIGLGGTDGVSLPSTLVGDHNLNRGSDNGIDSTEEIKEVSNMLDCMFEEHHSTISAVISKLAALDAPGNATDTSKEMITIPQQMLNDMQAQVAALRLQLREHADSLQELIEQLESAAASLHMTFSTPLCCHEEQRKRAELLSPPSIPVPEPLGGSKSTPAANRAAAEVASTSRIPREETGVEADRSGPSPGENPICRSLNSQSITFPACYATFMLGDIKSWPLRCHCRAPPGDWKP